MLASLSFTARQYVRAYERYAVDFWEHMTPGQYVGILLFVGVCGYILMRSSR